MLCLYIIGPERTSVQVVAVSFEEGTFPLEAQNDILLTQWPMPAMADAIAGICEARKGIGVQ